MITTLAPAVHADPVAEYDATASELARLRAERAAIEAALAVALPRGPMAAREPLERLRRVDAALPGLEVMVRDLRAVRDEHLAHADRARRAEAQPIRTRLGTELRALLEAAAAKIEEGIAVDREYGAPPQGPRFAVVAEALTRVRDMAGRLDGGAA